MSAGDNDDGRPTPVFYLAGGTGISAETLGNTILAQFPGINFQSHRIPFITNVDQARRAVARMDAAATEHTTPLVFSTCAQDDVRAEIALTKCAVIDLFGSHLEDVERILHVNATRRSGSAHGVRNERRYAARMRAIEYAIAHDDGQSLRRIADADLILTAPSRCGKTPTSMYLAMQHGLMVANYPLADGDFDTTALPRPLRGSERKLFGILSTPERLAAVRNERRPASHYSSLDQCSFELRRAEAIYKANNIPYINSERMSVEEMSAVILQTLDSDESR